MVDRLTWWLVYEKREGLKVQAHRKFSERVNQPQGTGLAHKNGAEYPPREAETTINHTFEA
jgi:hypothetical protein